MPKTDSMAEYKEFLKNIFQATAAEEKFKIYNMVNVASLLLGIRTGIILMGIKGDDIPQIIGMLSENNLEAKQYLTTSGILVIRQDAPAELRTIYDRIVPLPPRAPMPINFIPDPNSYPPPNALTPKNKLNLNTGAVLGYLEPIALQKSANYPVIIHFAITIGYKGTAYTIRFFPQRLAHSANTYKDKLDEMKRRLETELPTVLPNEFTLESVKLVSEGVPKGGKRRKSRRKSKGKPTRKGRKVVGSS
jgi:hypothetical protein